MSPFPTGRATTAVKHPDCKALSESFTVRKFTILPLALHQFFAYTELFLHRPAGESRCIGLRGRRWSTTGD
jgi:hypothetical protein